MSYACRVACLAVVCCAGVADLPAQVLLSDLQARRGRPGPVSQAVELPGAAQWLVRPTPEQPEFVQKAAFVGNDRLATVSSDGAVLFWKAGDLTLDHKTEAIEVARGKLLDLRSDPTGKCLALVTARGAALVEDGRAIQCAFEGKTQASFAAVSPDCRRVAWTGSGAQRGRVQVVEIATGKVVANVPDAGMPTCVAFSGDGKQVFVYDARGKTFRAFSAADGAPQDAPFQPGFHTVAIVASPDGKYIAAGGQLGLQVHDLTAGKTVLKLDDPALDFAFGNGVIYWARGIYRGQRGGAAAWDRAAGRAAAAPAMGSQSCLGLSADGSLLLAAGSGYRPSIWRLNPTGPALLAGQHVRAVVAVLLPSADVAVSADQDGRILRWTLADGKPHVVAEAPTPSGLKCLERLGRGDRLAAAGPDGTVRLFKIGDLAAAGDLSTGLFRINGLASTPDGQQLAVAGQALNAGPAARPFQLATLKVADGKPAMTQHELAMACHAIAFSPDGTRLAMALGYPRGQPGWGMLSLVEIDGAQRKGYGDPVGDPFGIAWTSDGELLLVAGPEAKLTAVDGRTGRAAFELAVAAEGMARAVATSPDGTLMAAATDGGLVRVWERATRTEVFSGRLHGAAVTALAFSPDAAILLSGAADGSLVHVTLKAQVAAAGKPSDLDALWQRLGAQDWQTAGQAAAAMQSAGAKAVSYIKASVQAAQIPPETQRQIAQWIEQLGDERFSQRKEATQALQEMGYRPLGLLRQAASEAQGEKLARIRQLIDAIEKATVELTEQQRREIRAADILRQIGSAEARGLLMQWSQGAEGAPLTRAAEAAVKALDAN